MIVVLGRHTDIEFISVAGSRPATLRCLKRGHANPYRMSVASPELEFVVFGRHTAMTLSASARERMRPVPL
jgi:hypothetical protein